MINYSAKKTKKKSPGIAVLLSFFFTGAGQLYAENISKGITLLIIYFILAPLTVATAGVLFIILLPYWIWGMVDAKKQVEEYNDDLSRQLYRLKTIEKNNKIEKERAERAKYAQKNLNNNNTVKKNNNKIKTADFVSRLKKISKLRESNFLDDEECKNQKNKLISSLNRNQPEDSPEDFLSELISLKEENHINEEDIKEIKKYVLSKTN